MSNNPDQELDTAEIAEDSNTGTTEAAIDTEAAATSDATEDKSDSPQADEVYYDIEGEEISLGDIKKWKSGHMMQSDYTKSKQQLSEERKKFSQEREEVTALKDSLSALQEKIYELSLGDLNKVDMDDLLQHDTSEYVRVKELKNSRKQQLDGLYKQLAETQKKEIEVAHRQLSESLGWADQDKMQSDIKAIDSYVKQAGIPDQDFAKINSPKVMEAILEAAKYRKLMSEKPSVTKRVVQAPKTVKPKVAQDKPQVKSLAERMYGKSQRN